MRPFIQGSYVHHKELKAAQGIKITAQGLESAVAGTQLYVVGPDDDVDDVMDEAMQDMNSILSRVDKSGEGVCVQVSARRKLMARSLQTIPTLTLPRPVSRRVISQPGARSRIFAVKIGFSVGEGCGQNVRANLCSRSGTCTWFHRFIFRQTRSSVLIT